MKEMIFEPYSQGVAANPYPVYKRLREENPIFYSGEYGLTFLPDIKILTNCSLINA